MRLIAALACLAFFGGPGLADCFSEELSGIEAAADAGEWKKAQRLAHQLDRRIIFRVAKHSEDCVRPAVARLAALRGITLVALGDLEKGLWLWQGAKVLAADQLPNLDDFPAARALGLERDPAPVGDPSPGSGLKEWSRTTRSTVPRLLNLTIGNNLRGRAEVTGYLSSDGLPIRVDYQATSALLAYIVIDLCSELPHPEGMTSASCSHTFSR